MPQQPISHSDTLGLQRPTTAPGRDSGPESNLVEFSSPSFDAQAEFASVSADLLNDIVERARSATNAAGAAIALRQGEDIVCFAETGTSAPSVGARLNLTSGLSGACAQSRTFQRCDDTETDARVDAELCRRLGLRSMLVCPILRRDALLGIVEVFSPDAHTFGDREVQALASLSRTISYILDSGTVVPGPQDSGQVAFEAQPEEGHVSAPETAPVEEPPAAAADQTEVALYTAPRQDYWNIALTVAVIALAITLGWLLGRGGPRRTNPAGNKPAPSQTASLPQQAAPVPPPAAPVPPAAVEEKPAPPPAPKHESAAPQNPRPGELVITQNGKVIYRQPTPQPSGTANQAPPAPASASTATGVSNAVLISPETANQYLAQRVEPEYPEQAREQHLQGPVTLQAIVGKDGSVKSLETISGDPQLAAAARTAVNQWRFKPFLQDGKPAEFQTQVTVNFRLP